MRKKPLFPGWLPDQTDDQLRVIHARMITRAAMVGHLLPLSEPSYRVYKPRLAAIGLDVDLWAMPTPIDRFLSIEESDRLPPLREAA